MYNYRMQTQLQLLPPTAAEIRSVAKEIEAGFSNVTINISGKNIAKTNSEIAETKKLLAGANTEAKSFFDTMSSKLKGFSAYVAASLPVLKLVDAIREATEQVIKYEAELLKLAQITNTSTKYIREQSSVLIGISQTYNIAINKVGQLVGTLAQAGLGFRDAAKAAELIAKTTLLATFDSMGDTTDGLIAIMNTFNLTVTETGRVLDQINSLSKAYAVESGDLIEGVRKTGGAFAAAGGKVEELNVLMTTVRQTTRESADTIATGFRTIFSRLQRPQTIEYFRKLGIELETAEGKFAGPYEAITRISKGLAELDITIGDLKFAEVVEEIGGIRQIQKVIPLLTKYDLIQEALAKTNGDSAESFKDLEKAQEGIGYKMGKLQKEFAALIYTLASSKTFGTIVDVFVNISSAIIKATEAVSILLPLLAGAAAFKLTGAINNFATTGSFGPKNNPPQKDTASGNVVQTSWAKIKNDKNSQDSELEVSGGKKITTQIDLAMEVAKLTSELGDVGKTLIRTSVDMESLNGRGGIFRLLKDSVSGKKSGQIRLDPSDGDQGIASHEFGHLVDTSLGGGENSSKKRGTFQNYVANASKSNITDRLRSGGYDEEDIKYKTKDQELFAEFYSKSNKEVRKILASTTDLSDGMDKLADYVSKTDDRLYGDAQNSPELSKMIEAKKSATSVVTQPQGLGKSQDEIELSRWADQLKRYIADNTARIKDLDNNPNSSQKHKSIYASENKSYSEELKLIQKQLVELANKGQTALGPTPQPTKPTPTLPQQLPGPTTVQGGTPFSSIFTPAKPTTQSVSVITDADRAKVQKAIETVFKAIGNLESAETSLTKEYTELTSDLAELDEIISAQVLSKKNTAKATDTRNVIATKLADVENKLIQTSINLEKATSKRTDLINTSRGLNDSQPPSGFIGPPHPPEALPPSKMNAAWDAFYNVLSKNTIAFAIYGQAFVSTVKQFGFKPNQDALTSGNSQAIIANSLASEVKPLGRLLNSLGSKFGETGKPLARFGALLYKAGPKIAGFLNVLGTISSIGGIFDAFVSKDFKGLRDRQIQLGDASAAAALAAKAYNQEMLRGIPVIGGFLAGLSSITGIGGDEENLSTRGKIAVASSRLEATIIGLDKKIQSSKRANIRAINSGDSDQSATVASQRIADIGGLDQEVSKDKALLKTMQEERKTKEKLTRAYVSISTLGLGEIGGVSSKIGKFVGGVTDEEKKLTQGISSGSQESTKQKTDYIKENQERFSFKASEITKNGGSLDDVFTHMEKNLGDGVFKGLFGDVKGKTPKEIRKEQTADLAEKNLLLGKSKIKKEEDSKKSGYDEDASQLLVDEAQNAADLSEARLHNTDVMLTNIHVQQQLNKESAVRAATIIKEIEALKKWNEYSDTIAKSAISFDEIADSLSHIGTGTVSRSEFAQSIGLSDQALNLAPDKLLRDKGLTDEIQNALSKTGNGEQFSKTREAASKFEGMDLSKLTKYFQGDKQQLYENAAKEPGSDSADLAMSKDILAELGLKDNAQAAKVALDFTKDLRSGGTVDAGEAKQKAVDNLNASSVSQVQDLQKMSKELYDKTNQYFLSTIKLEDMRIQNTREIYAANKRYRDESIDFTTDTANFLLKSSGRTKELQSIANQAKGLDAKSRRAGVFGDNVPQNVAELSANVRNSADLDGSDATKPVEEAKLYADKIRDSIGYEQQRIELMKQSAIVVRDYNQALRDAQGDLVTEFAFGTNDDRGNLLRTAAYTQEAATSGNLNNVPEEFRKDISGFLDKFANVKLAQFGGQTGARVKGRIAANEAVSNNLIRPDQADDFAKKSAHDAVPIDVRMAEQIQKQSDRIQFLMNEEKTIRDALIARETDNVTKFEEAVNKMLEGLIQHREDIVNPAQAVEVKGQQDVTVRMPDIQAVVNTEVTRTVYTAVSKRFQVIADKLSVVKSPEEMANVFREEVAV